VLAAAAAFVAGTTGWLPRTGVDASLLVAFVLLAGTCLATVMTAFDRGARQPTRPGEAVGRAARRVVERLSRIAAQAEAEPERFGARRVAALRRALVTASDPDLLPWIPADVRGRAELLLARAIAAQAGPRWASDPVAHAEVASLLARAAANLEDPRAAEADRRALAAAPAAPRARPRARDRVRLRIRPATRIAAGLSLREAPDENQAALEAEALAEAERAPQGRRLTVIP
jgi:hypothetical protein